MKTIDFNFSKHLLSFVVLLVSMYGLQAQVTETGFRVMINGIQCLRAADFGDNIDELYLDIYVDGRLVQKVGPRTMKPVEKDDWQKFWGDLFTKDDQNVAAFFFAAKQEYWLMPGAWYAEDNVTIELWEADSGRNPAFGFDPDDKIGAITIKKTDPDNDQIIKDFNNSGEAGHWRLVCTKETRKEVAPEYTGTVSRIPVRIPIKNQGREGACVAYATTAALATAYLKKKGISSTTDDLFDGSAFYKTRDNNSVDEGWWYSWSDGSGALDKLLLNPIPFKNDPGKKLQMKSYYAYGKDGTVKKYYVENGRIKSDVQTGSKNGLDNMRAQLKSGHALLARYDVYDDFGTYVDYDGIYGGRVSATSKRAGGHAIMVVGYHNPAKGAPGFPVWYIQNSWGPNWGKNGQCTFAEGAVGIDENMYRIGDFEVITESIASGTRIAIQTDTKEWISRCADCQAMNNNIRYTASSHMSISNAPRPTETFTVIAKGSKIALKADNGYYLKACYSCAKANPNSVISVEPLPAGTTEPSGAYLFQFTEQPDGSYTIQSSNGRYWTRYYRQDSKPKFIATYRPSADLAQGKFKIVVQR